MYIVKNLNMERFEYKVVTFGMSDISNLEKGINFLGKDGWELVDVENFDLVSLMIFKRKLK